MVNWILCGTVLLRPIKGRIPVFAEGTGGNQFRIASLQSESNARSPGYETEVLATRADVSWIHFDISVDIDCSY
jgi:hypothetical protein